LSKNSHLLHLSTNHRQLFKNLLNQKARKHSVRLLERPFNKLRLAQVIKNQLHSHNSSKARLFLKALQVVFSVQPRLDQHPKMCLHHQRLAAFQSQVYRVSLQLWELGHKVRNNNPFLETLVLKLHPLEVVELK
jgi:hypothetical protein